MTLHHILTLLITEMLSYPKMHTAKEKHHNDSCHAGLKVAANSRSHARTTITLHALQVLTGITGIPLRKTQGTWAQLQRPLPWP
jgi:hypothetical protein